MLKDLQKGIESSFWMHYEKRKMKECVNTLQNLAAAFLTEENTEEEKDRYRLFLKKRLKENRVLVADHLKEIAQIIDNVAEEKFVIEVLPIKQEKQLAKLLSMEGIIMEEISILEKENGRKEILLRMYQSHLPKNKNYYTVEEVGEFLSVYFNKRLVPCINTPFFLMNTADNFCFEEEAAYTVLTGYSKVTKAGEKVSGDNYVFFESSEKIFYSALSDGMGSGEKASVDSEEVIEMVERFLEGGCSEVLTAKMVNNALLAKGDGRNMSTLDMCGIDLHNAQASFIKVGATYSFLKRDGYVEKIPSVSLPLGVFYEIEMNQHKKQLLDGDYIFMFSDGILDHFPGEEGEELLKEIIREVPYKRPNEMASHVMKMAIMASQGTIKDDTTILVMGVWENKH